MDKSLGVDRPLKCYIKATKDKPLHVDKSLGVDKPLSVTFE